MCTYNGESYLAEQLESFERQTHKDWVVWASDDGSKDNTLAVLNHYKERWGNQYMKVVKGPELGFVANFLSLTCRADLESNFFAWSDQDDVWEDSKLESALEWLQGVPHDVPALYCGRTELIDEAGVSVGFSPKFNLPPCFSNSLVQNIGGGNTMVFNQAARALLQEAGPDVDVPSHDWWAYQLVSGAGGIVRYDPLPKVKYRQHSENLIGSNSSWRARLRRIGMVFQGRFCEWNTRNIHALENISNKLLEEHQITLGKFKEARNKQLPSRALGVFRAGVHRQTLFGNLALVLAVLLRKI